MKILVVADLHYTLKQWDWVSLRSESFDAIVIAGDLLDIVSIVDIDVQILVVLKYLRRIQPEAKLIVASGNHDGNARNDADESVAAWLGKAREAGVHVDGDSVEIEDCLFTICPWWDGPQTRGEVANLLERDSRKEKRRWIWVYHAPPQGSAVSWTGKKHFGDAYLRDWIHQYRPDLVLGGHVHHAPFAKEGSWVDDVGGTRVFNMGRQIGPDPTHIIIDTEANTARWFSLAGAEEVRLEGELLRTELV